MEKVSFHLVVIVLICLEGVYSKNARIKRYSNPKEEYQTIFRNLPTLFQYFITVLEDNPGILERSDITVFKREVLHEENNKTNIVLANKKYGKKNELNPRSNDVGMKPDTIRSNENKEKNEFKNNEFDISYKKSKGNFVQRGLVASNDNNKMKKENPNKNNKDKNEYINVNEEHTVENGDIFDEDTNNDEKDEDGDVIFGALGLDSFRLTPEEITEKAIMVEEKLEEHNKSR